MYEPCTHIHVHLQTHIHMEMPAHRHTQRLTQIQTHTYIYIYIYDVYAYYVLHRFNVYILYVNICVCTYSQHLTIWHGSWQRQRWMTSVQTCKESLKSFELIPAIILYPWLWVFQ